jgi:AcrR family transcriptional regulator
MPAVLISTKEQIVRTAERLFAGRGVDGVSLRQIGAAAGNGNNSAVQYHFGSKHQLVQAIFEYRLPDLQERRRILTAARRPDDLRSWVECYVLPILEHSEEEGSHYLCFIATLQQQGRRDIFERIPVEYQASTRVFRERVAAALGHIPEPLRTHRITQAMAFTVHAAADRQRARASEQALVPFAVFVTDLLDGLLGFLQAPVSLGALAALEGAEHAPSSWPVLL